MSVTELPEADERYRPATLAGLWQRIEREDVVRLAAVSVLAVAAMLGTWLGWSIWLIVAIAALGLVVGCWPIVLEAWQDVRARRMSMELSMLIAIVAAALIGEWVTALVITAFVLAAEILEDLSMDRGRDALTELMSFLPATVQLRDAQGERSVELDEVRVGDTVVVLPGGRVPVDGTVVEGYTSLDQSRVTGEPLPVDVEVGSTVFAGSVNQHGAIAIRADQVGEASSYGQIVAAVQAAQESEAPVQRLADRIAGWLVYLALGGALVTYLVTRDLTATVSVVLVTGACGVAAGTPLAILAGIARTARSGGFIKDGTHLEELSRVDTVVFDKTGTLTRGEPRVVEVLPAEGFTAHEVLGVAAAAESLSEHPTGQAILAHARAAGIEVGAVDSFDYTPGRGVVATVSGRRVRAGNAALVPEPPSDQPGLAGTTVRIAVDDRFAGSVVLADTVRDSAAGCIRDLHKLGLRIVMMTGDQPGAAHGVGEGLGIDDIRAGLLPAEKVSLIQELRQSGRRLAMVGDGVNDAPALAGANVGIAMGSGTHVAHETADIVLISSDLADLTEAVRTARRARRIILANFVGTIAVDVVGMVLAAFGLIGPLLAGLIHVGSESAFILNSARLIPAPRRGHEPDAVLARPPAQLSRDPGSSPG